MLNVFSKHRFTPADIVWFGIFASLIGGISKDWMEYRYQAILLAAGFPDLKARPWTGMPLWVPMLMTGGVLLILYGLGLTSFRLMRRRMWT
jgi:cytochrome b subunit of formate dehydrogenase